ncbi:hypothetical protein [Halorussus ruber]|uniref:hypothetical protein n=1 Tax=Halorussus ruber TaxID=1126238 RepID=UPI00109295C0|nr:hypothetical protein [Halorussus ruber]
MQENAQEPNTALVFVDSYKPGIGFRPISRVQQPTVNQILGYIDPANPDPADGAVVDPADWNGYIVRYQNCGPGNYELVFLREGLLETGQTYSFTTNAVFFNNELGLLESEIQRGAGPAGQGAAEETTGDETQEAEQEGAEETATTTEETTTTAEEPATTTEGTPTTTEEPTTTTTGETATTTEETTTLSDQTTTVTRETTPPTETTTTPNQTTTQEVLVNATETGDGG